jgi:hypothetical protein
MFKNSVLLFTHIERCGGSSIHRYLRHELGSYYIVRPGAKIFSNEPEMAVHPNHLRLLIRTPFIAGLGGHGIRPWSVPSTITNLVRITILRQPVDRFLSHLCLLNGQPGARWSIEGCACDRRFQNWQTVKLAGLAKSSVALKNLSQYQIVDKTGRLGETLPKLTVSMGGKGRPFTSEINRSRAPIRWSELSDRERALVEKANDQDLQLWESDPTKYEISDIYPVGTRLRINPRLWSLTVENIGERLVRNKISEESMALCIERSRELNSV